MMLAKSCSTQISRSRLSPSYLLILVTVLLALLPSVFSREASRCSPKILLFTKTAGFRHDSIPSAVKVIKSLGTGELTPSALDPSVAEATWNTIHSEDEKKFERSTYLKQFDAVVFAFTTDVDPPGVGTILSDKGFDNFMKYIESGGNFVGIHSATNTLYAQPAYGRLAGGFFSYHAESQRVSLKATGGSHPATSRLPSTFRIKEEMYHLRSNPRRLPSPAHVVLTNATAYPDPGGSHREGKPQPLAWWREGRLLSSNSTQIGGDLDGQRNYNGGTGRSFVTTLGHETATWSNDAFQGHIMGAIAWALESETSYVVNSSGRIGNSECTGTDDDSEINSSTTEGSSGDNPASSSSTPSSSRRVLLNGSILSPMGGLLLAHLCLGAYLGM